MRLYFRQLVNSRLWQTNQSHDVGKPFVTLVRRHPSKSRNHFRDKKDQSFNHPPWRFPSAFTVGLRSPRQKKRLVRRRERKSCRYSSQAKKISLSLSLRSRARMGPYCRRSTEPPAHLVSVTNDAACSPLDVTRYQLVRSSLTWASTLARRDSTECSRYAKNSLVVVLWRGTLLMIALNESCELQSYTYSMLSKSESVDSH